MEPTIETLHKGLQKPCYATAYIAMDQFVDPTEKRHPRLHVITGQFVMLDTVLDPFIFIVTNKAYKQEKIKVSKIQTLTINNWIVLDFVDTFIYLISM